MGNIKEGSLVLDSLKYLPASHEEFPALLLQNGDLLFNRTNSAELVGKSAIYRGNPSPCSCASYLIRARLRPDYVPEFLAYFINSTFGRAWVNSVVSQQVGQANVNGTKLKALSVPVPPLPEQRRIVAEIEKQFTRLEAGVAALRRVQANLKRYRAAVLKAACEGRLVPTEAALARSPRSTKNGPPAYETGEALLARILTERRQNWQGRGQYKEPAAPETAKLPALPEGWTWAQFGYLGKDPFNTVQTGPFGAQLHNTEFTETGVPVIAVGNLTGTGFRTDGLYYVNTTKAKQLARYDVWAGDLLFARSGATLGKVCVAPAVVQDWRMTGHILRARLNQDFINPRIAVYALAALPAVRKQVFGNVRGVTRPGFNTGLLESILIPVPPLAEQTRIVAEVERRLSVVEELESVVTANLQRATRLRQSILQKAFTGELTS